MRDRRIDAEWELLVGLAEANPDVLVDVRREQDEFHVVMKRTPAWVANGGLPRVETEHALRFVYPRHYPTLPIEAYMVRPILHVNVDAKTGFVCLWQSYRPSQTIVEAVLIARSILAQRTANWDPVHRMQEVSFGEGDESCVLPMAELFIPESCRVQTFASRGGRQRLMEASVTNETSTNDAGTNETGTSEPSTRETRESFCVF